MEGKIHPLEGTHVVYVFLCRHKTRIISIAPAVCVYAHAPPSIPSPSHFPLIPSLCPIDTYLGTYDPSAIILITGSNKPMVAHYYTSIRVLRLLCLSLSPVQAPFTHPTNFPTAMYFTIGPNLSHIL